MQNAKAKQKKNKTGYSLLKMMTVSGNLLPGDYPNPGIKRQKQPMACQL
jgi:hypothetical protein